MRIRIRRKRISLGPNDIRLECQRCGYRRDANYVTGRGIICARCGSVLATVLTGRYTPTSEEIAAGEERVRIYRQEVEERLARNAPRTMRVKLAKRTSMAKQKLKIVSRTKTAEEAKAKTAQPGTTKTGAKVVKTKAGKGQPGSSQGRFIGVTSGLGVTKFQNQTFDNQKKRKLTDAQIAALWSKEFPNAKATYSAEMVPGVRSAYNRGRHGNNDGQPVVPPVPQYDETGAALPMRGEKGAAKKAAKEAKAEAAPAKKVIKKLKKKA